MHGPRHAGFHFYKVEPNPVLEHSIVTTMRRYASTAELLPSELEVKFQPTTTPISTARLAARE